METIYTANTRVVNGENFYFVKKYSIFAEYEDSPKILDSLGMHTDFYRACYLAKVYDEAIIKKLLGDLNLLREQVPVVPMNPVRSVTNAVIKNTHNVLSKLRLAGIN